MDQFMLQYGLVLSFMCLSAGLGTYVSETKGRNVLEGFLLGAFFSFFGVLIAALLPSKKGE